ncbi:MAG TPA: hypothetical protein VEA81_10755 [Burkholderiaceae bacterium]|nr:hypothetical protein [Burkholderiaceae bacterium]
MRIVFGIMSATQSPAVVDQLAGLLHPHPVVVHHDHAKRPGFALTARNAWIVPDPRPTGWGTWGFAEAIVHTLRRALDAHPFDYFQLLSPTCLPIQPIERFEAFVRADDADAHADLMPVDRDDDTLMTFGYRTYTPADSLRFRVLRRARRWYFDEDAELVQTHSLSMLRRTDGAEPERLPLGARAGLALTRMAARGRLGAHPFEGARSAMVGGVFFGARRSVCEHLVERVERDERLTFFRGLKIVDETLFPTLLAQSGARLGPSNHAISPFTRDGSPRWIEEGDVERLVATGRFFARKFHDDPRHSTRMDVIERLRVHTDSVMR